MEKIVLFCKSYFKDMYRAKRMVESVYRFNTDNISLYVSVPNKDFKKFKELFADITCNIITDDLILEKTQKVYGTIPKSFPSYIMQQLIKLEFWRMEFCENYIWLDSDSYFIKPFKTEDFFYDENTPYIIQHDSKELRKFCLKYDKLVIEDFERLAGKLKKAFNRSGDNYNFGEPPLIWSRKVLKSLYDDYLKPNRMSIYELLEKYPCEIQLYGEYLHYSKVIPIIPKEPIFKCYHYVDQFFESQMYGEYEFSLAKDYFGIVMQSNWTNIKKKDIYTLLRWQVRRFRSKFRWLADIGR